MQAGHKGERRVYLFLVRRSDSNFTKVLSKELDQNVTDLLRLGDLEKRADRSLGEMIELIDKAIKKEPYTMEEIR